MKISRMAVLLLLAIGAGSLGGCGGSLGEGKNNFTGMNLPEDSAAVIATAADPSRSGAKVASDKKKRKLAHSARRSNTAYYIGAQDVLEISVFKVKELSKSVQVADSGTINYPLVGEVQAKGKTAQQLERLLTAKLGAKYLENPQVTVFVKEYNSQRVTVSGAVKKPGVFPVRTRTTLVSAIAMAGGLDKNSDDVVVVSRIIDGKSKAVRHDLSAIEKGNAEDPVLQGDDKVVVGKTAIKEIYSGVLDTIRAVGSVTSIF